MNNPLAFQRGVHVAHQVANVIAAIEYIQLLPSDYLLFGIPLLDIS
jgi:hypothetical protein